MPSLFWLHHLTECLACWMSESSSICLNWIQTLSYRYLEAFWMMSTTYYHIFLVESQSPSNQPWHEIASFPNWIDSASWNSRNDFFFNYPVYLLSTNGGKHRWVASLTFIFTFLWCEVETEYHQPPGKWRSILTFSL